LDGLGFKSWEGKEIFSSPKLSRPVLEPTQPPVWWVLVLYLWHKAARIQNGQSPAASIKFKKEWNCSFAPPICLHRWTETTFIYFLLVVEEPVFAETIPYILILLPHILPFSYFSKSALDMQIVRVLS
jgi:hypothetical protein